MKRRKPPSTTMAEATSSTTTTIGTTMLLLLFLASAAMADPVPVPDDCASTPFESGVALSCSLSAINSAVEKTDFGVIPSARTRNLVHLRKLVLDGCHLREIPERAFWGLPKLRSLTITTRNAGVLKVDSDAFLGLERLEELNLSGNHVRYLAPNALCPVGSTLRTLNLSRNEISSLSDLGQSSLACSAALKSVDLSRNRISIVSADQLASWGGLEELRVNDNKIRGVKDNVFRACAASLKFVDFSNNELASLPETLLAGATALRRIALSNNSLETLPAALFRSQSQSLEVIDLSGNRLSTLRAPLLGNLPLLATLDLSSNQLESIESPAALRGLKSLQSLKLGRNRLTRLPNFPSLPSLRYLVLSHNFLDKLNNRLLYKVPSLSHLLLDDNRLEELPERFFANTSRLTVLDLSANRLSGEIPAAVNALRNLQSFAIGGNRVDNLSQLSLSALWRLQASGNRLKNVSAVQLNGLPALQVLDLSDNRIASIEKGAFAANKPLQAIRLDGNRLSRMGGLFHDLPNLNWLNVSDNQIAIFDYGMVPKTLTWLDVHRNNLTSLENYFGLEAELKLTHLDAGFNQLKELGPQNVPNGVETLLLNDNHIATLVPYTFFKKGSLRKVDLSVNRLESIDRNSLRISTGSGGGPVVSAPKFYFGGNPIRCDCHMAWFKGINSIHQADSLDSNNLQNFPVVADLESIYCELLYSRQRSIVPLVDAPAEDFLCAYKTHCFALCHCCDYDACDCEMTCPDNCTCYHDTTWTKNIAECSGAEFNTLPDQLPMDATEIFLDGNDIGDLHSHTFIGRKNLRVLYLNDSKIAAVDNHTFNGLAVLEYLHLEGNSITKMQGDEFHGLTQLRELYLHDNLIGAVNNATFRDLKSLVILSLHNNRLVNFPAWRLALNPSLKRVSLGGNDWSCQCGFLKAFREWMGEEKGQKVIDMKDVACHDPDSDKVIKVVNATSVALCVESAKATTHVMIRDGVEGIDRVGGDVVGVSGTSSFWHELLPVALAVISVVVLTAVLVILIFVYRDEMRMWLYTKFFHRVDGSAAGASSLFDADADKLFDAFVTYSAKDDSFVRQMIAPELEMARPDMALSRNSSHHLYKLCLFYRDIPASAAAPAAPGNDVYSSNLGDAIVQAAEASRRTVLVLSEHFLKVEWARFDYKSGLHQAFRTAAMASSGGRRGRGRWRRPKRLIVITLGDVARRRDLDPDLRILLKSATVLQWSDKRFWEKLKYALPDTAPLTMPHPPPPVKSATRASSMNGTLMTSSGFSPDDSFRYETYHRPGNNQNHPHTLNLNHHHNHPYHHHQPHSNGFASHTMMHPQQQHHFQQQQQQQQLHQQLPRGEPIYHAPSTTNHSLGGGSSTYQSISTPDEQDSSTRTMTIHI